MFTTILPQDEEKLVKFWMSCASAPDDGSRNLFWMILKHYEMRHVATVWLMSRGQMIGSSWKCCHRCIFKRWVSANLWNWSGVQAWTVDLHGIRPGGGLCSMYAVVDVVDSVSVWYWWCIIDLLQLSLAIDTSVYNVWWYRQLACVEVTNEFIFDLYIIRICICEENLLFIMSDCVCVGYFAIDVAVYLWTEK